MYDETGGKRTGTMKRAKNQTIPVAVGWDSLRELVVDTLVEFLKLPVHQNRLRDKIEVVVSGFFKKVAVPAS